MLAVRGTEPAQRLDQLFARSGVAHIAHGERDDLFPVDVLGQEGQRGRLPSDHPDVEVVRHRLGEAGELREHGLRLVEREDDEPAQHVWPDRMELELEAGDNTKIPTATPQPPEEVIVFRFAGVHLSAVRRDDIRGEPVVDGHAVLPAEPAEAAAEGQAGHARGRVDAQRRGETVRLRGRVEVRKGAAGLDGRPAGLRIHLDALHHERSIMRPSSQTALPAMLCPPLGSRRAGCARART